MITQKEILETESNYLVGTFLAKLTHLQALHGVEDFVYKFKLKLEKDGEPEETVEAFEAFINLYLE